MIREARDWERNVGQLTGKVNDGKAPNFTRGELKQIFTQHQFVLQHYLPHGQHKMISSSNGRFDGTRNKPTGDKERR